MKTARSFFSSCLLLGWLPVNAEVACNATSECERKLRPGSTCREGLCDNPFQRGCLRTMLGADFPLRICNSGDGDDAEERGVCRRSPLDYVEISIGPANWESSMFLAWIMQIVLSELADVPAYIDTGVGGGELGFYDPGNGFAYPAGSYHDFEGLYRANDVKDCREVDATRETCAHVLPEVWPVRRYFDDDRVERDGNGMVGHLGWYVSTDTIREHPSLASHWGLRSNRALLAEVFRRPTTWKDYCEKISSTGCQVDDGIAATPPEAGKENFYFAKGMYTGYFRATEKNNCSLNKKCTGHFIDYPCYWSAYTDSQLYWNDIPLENDGEYSYSDILQIMEASNATKSPAIFMWWYPDGNIEKYDFFNIELMETSSACLENRPEPIPHRCNVTREELIGSREGSCGYTPHRLEKLFSLSLPESMDTPDATRSPAYQTLRNIRVNDVVMNELLLKWMKRGIDTYGYDPREVVCEWAARHVGNEDFLIDLWRFVPAGYPRNIVQPNFNKPYNYAAMAFAAFTILLVTMTACSLFFYRNHAIMKRAQLPFLCQFLFGFMLLSLGAIMYTLPPSDASCISRIWFELIGYTQGLVPLLLKVAAINRLLRQARRMQRVTITKAYLYKCECAAVTLVLIFLSCWTIIDPSLKVKRTKLVSENTVQICVNCSSKSNLWMGAAFTWEALCIFAAAILAFQSRSNEHSFNESTEVGNMAYSHFLFLVLRLVVWFLPSGTLDKSARNATYSFLLSADAICALVLYFGPKLYACKKGTRRESVGLNFNGLEEEYSPEDSYKDKYIQALSEKKALSKELGETHNALRMSEDKRIEAERNFALMFSQSKRTESMDEMMPLSRTKSSIV